MGTYGTVHVFTYIKMLNQKNLQNMTTKTTFESPGFAQLVHDTHARKPIILRHISKAH